MCRERVKEINMFFRTQIVLHTKFFYYNLNIPKTSVGDVQSVTLLLFSENSTQCGQPRGTDPDPHQGVGHSDREAGQGACDGTPQHENCTAGGGDAASPTAPSPQEQH